MPTFQLFFFFDNRWLKIGIFLIHTGGCLNYFAQSSFRNQQVSPATPWNPQQLPVASPPYIPGKISSRISRAHINGYESLTRVPASAEAKFHKRHRYIPHVHIPISKALSLKLSVCLAQVVSSIAPTCVDWVTVQAGWASVSRSACYRMSQ